MKMKHNKKRNTAFIFEALIRELTKAVVARDEKKKGLIIKLIRENFKGNSILARDLDLYKAILDTKYVDRHLAEKMVFEARMRKKILDEKELFAEQTKVINKINKSISSDVFTNFIPNYRDIATIYQIFDYRTKTRQRVLLESQVIDKMISSKKESLPSIKPVDNLTYKTFVQKFNEKYKNELIFEQKALLGYYIGSFSDNSLELKVFLNEEISRLRKSVMEASRLPEIKEDAEMLKNTKKVIEILDNCSKTPIDNDFIQNILKIQSLVKEIES